jgi:hypothetical protein
MLSIFTYVIYSKGTIYINAENMIKATVRPDANKVEHSRTNANKRADTCPFFPLSRVKINRIDR